MRIGAAALLVVSMESVALANGGPFLVREAGGDPATKGAPAPILPDLLPGREARLQVVKEELLFRFTGHPASAPIDVSAQYSIHNPTDDDVVLEIGFPIVRGIFQPYHSGVMGGGRLGPPIVGVQLDKEPHHFDLVTNSDLLTRIRRHAYQIIDDAFAARPGLKALRDQLKAAAGDDKAAEAAQKRLAATLLADEGWSERDARLLANFARVVWQPPAPPPPPPPTQSQKPAGEEQVPEWLKKAYRGDGIPRSHSYTPPREVPFFDEPGTLGLDYFAGRRTWPPYLGPLASLGELKATQLLSHLANRFAPEAGRSYERIFTAWGGDVRERAVDLGTGALRPRENVSGNGLYARVEPFNAQVVVDPEKRAACKDIAENLPVTFTFAPMNLIRTKVTFPKRSTHVLGFTYAQHAFDDTAEPSSYQLAYLVHPASFWQQFGPINLTIEVPKGIPVRASVPTKRTETRAGNDVHKGRLKEKTGELLVATPKAPWNDARE